MCTWRAWRQILLPVFLSVFLIQLLINFSEDVFSQILRHSGKQGPKHRDKAECAEKKKCNSCIEDRGCFWCSGENTCKTFCFRSRCQLSSLFWLNCRIDMFGVLMLLLIAVIAGRPEGPYIHHWNRSVYDG